MSEFEANRALEALARQAAKNATPMADVSEMSAKEWEALKKKDFRYFLFDGFRHLGHTPTPTQYDIAWFLQHGPRRSIIMAFRGIGKSWITAFYALWLLYCDPQWKILVVSASHSRAAQFTNFCLALLREVPWLMHLHPQQHQRMSSENFDVGPARPDQSPSMRAVGINGQKTGSRADATIADDIEVPENAGTKLQREKLAESVREFGAIAKPETGLIKYLGTPQTEESIYNVLANERKYTIRIWCAEYPSAERREAYGGRLAPMIADAIAKSPIDLTGKPTEPSRFSREDLDERMMEWGRSGYALQYMLDTTLSDGDRYPLRLADLIVMGLDREQGPDVVAYGKSDKLVHKNLPMLGFNADRYYLPGSVSQTYSPYSIIVGSIDPSGRGADEAALVIGGELNGRVFILKVKGFLDGFAPETLVEIAQICVLLKVKLLRIESNFGQGMYGAVLRPYLEAAWANWNEKQPPGLWGQTGIEEEQAARAQKELRIIEALSAITQQHRLIFDEAVIQEDYDDCMGREEVDMEKRHRYSLAYQMSHVTPERDCLGHDDRLDALAALVSYWAPSFAINPATNAAAMARKRAQDELEALLKGSIVLVGGEDGDGSRPSPGGFKRNFRSQRRHS